jgi:hypothetical protein
MFLNVRDEVSYPYKAMCKVMVLYILIFNFLGDVKTEYSEQNGSKNSLNLFLS